MSRSSDHPALPLAQWPAADRRAWEAAVQPAEFLLDGGKGADWRAASKRTAGNAYARWLAWLAATGVDLANEAPAARITRERMRAYVAFLAEHRSSMTVATYLGVLCMLLLAMFPGQKWRWLQTLQRNCRRRSSPSRNKQSRLVDAQALEQLGIGLMAAAGGILDQPVVTDSDQRHAAAAARHYRDGLMIALLALRPLRMKNLLGIEIGTQLQKQPNGHTLSFTATETKNKRPLHQIWPKSLEANLSRYLTHVRPLLIAVKPRGGRSRSNRPPGAKLWIAQGGTPMTEGALQKALKRHTVPRFGHAINAHLFRDCAATTQGNQDPNNVRYAAQLLGHAGLRTTERSYIAPDSREALDTHQDLIAMLRSGRRRRRQAG